MEEGALGVSRPDIPLRRPSSTLAVITLVGMGWQESQRRQRDVAEQAKARPREAAASFPQAVLAITTLAWLIAVGWLVATLPERVPLHWSLSNAPDRWGSRGEAIAFAVLMPLVTAYPLILLSRLALIWPDAINLPDKKWWLATPERLVRLERLLREDMMLFAAVMVTILVIADLSIAVAAHHPSGAAPWWTFPAVGVALAALAAVIIRMAAGGRYRPADDGADATPPRQRDR